MFERVFVNITRHKAKSGLTILISFFIVLFFFVYLSGLLGNIVQYQNLGETLPVDGIITSITGRFTDDIRISPSRVQTLERSGLIENVEKNVNMFFDPQQRILDEDEALSQFFDTNLLGVNTETALPDFDSVTYMEGYDSGILKTDKAVCLVEEEYLKENGLCVGDTYKSTLYRKDYKDSEYTYKVVYTCDMEVTIIGTYSLFLSESSGDPTEIITPIRYIRELYREADVKFSVHSFRFTLKNGFDIDQFKTIARECDFKNRDPLSVSFDHVGGSLILYDESFIKTAEQLQKNIDLMQVFAPLVFLIIAFIGFLVSYLLMQSRQNEFAIMRSLGTAKGIVFITILIESLVLSFVGALIGTVLGVLLLSVDISFALIILPAFVILYLLGTFLALILIGRFSVMQVLTKKE